MPIKFSCGSCGSVLRVAEQHIGKQAKCPKCSEKCVVPPESEPDRPIAPTAPARQSAAPQKVGPPSKGATQVGPPNVGPPSVGPPNVGPPNVASPNVGPPNVGPPNVGPPSTGAANLGPPNVGPPSATAPKPKPGALNIGPPQTASAGVALPSFGEPPAAADLSPYSAPMPAGSSSGGSNTVMHPLYQARSMMNWFGWFLFVIGCFYCVTVVGAIVGWLPLWMGSLVKGASKSIKLGVERGDQNQLRLANQRLATFFKICGVITIVYVCLLSVILVVFLIGVIMGAVNG